MSKFWEKVFFIVSYVFQGSSYLSPYAYGIMHRLHHAYADTKEDPHSPKYSTNLFKMMWVTKSYYEKIFFKRDNVDTKFKKELPEWHKFDLWADSWPSRLIWVAIYITIYLIFSPHWAFFFLLPVHFVMGPVHGAIINWFAHKYGYRNFEVTNTSRNLMPLDVFMMGEGLHNNHHTYAGRANFAVKWYEFDPVFPVIKIFHWLKIIRLKPVSLLKQLPAVESDRVAV